MNTNAFPSPLVVLNKADGSRYPFVLKEDFSYVWRHRGILVGYELPTFEIKVPRNICDKIFYDALRDNGVGWLRAKTLYSAVRLGGGLSWPHSPESIAEERELYRESFGK